MNTLENFALTLQKIVLKPTKKMETCKTEKYEKAQNKLKKNFCVKSLQQNNNNIISTGKSKTTSR